MAQPTAKQEQVIRMVKDWFFSSDSRKRPFVFTGYAGTGKTFTVKKIIDALDLNEDQVAFTAFTGRASTILMKNGNPNSSTLHRLIYRPKVVKNNVIFELKESLSSELRLIVVDEFSMINDELMNDLESFNIPILLVGDMNQLPQVSGKANKYIKKSDINLDEVMRQALDNPIIYLATQARLGKKIEYGTYGDNVIVIPQRDLELEQMVWADQMIANTNNMVERLNYTIRKEHYKIDDPFPFVGEKLICLKNNWERSIEIDNIQQFLVNGLIGKVTYIPDRYKTSLESFQIYFEPLFFDEQKEFKNLLVDGLYFKLGLKNDNLLYEDPELNSRYKRTLTMRESFTNATGNKIDKFTFGYALTVYKSQGSEFNNLLFVDNPTSPAIKRASSYVGITRAKNSLIYVK